MTNGCGVATADYGHDGYPDLVVHSGDVSPQIRVFHNDGGTHHWVKIRLYGNRSNSFGVRAWVTMASGDLTKIREVETTTGTCTRANLPYLHFGLKYRS